MVRKLPVPAAPSARRKRAAGGMDGGTLSIFLLLGGAASRHGRGTGSRCAHALTIKGCACRAARFGAAAYALTVGVLSSINLATAAPVSEFWGASATRFCACYNIYNLNEPPPSEVESWLGASPSS